MAARQGWSREEAEERVRRADRSQVALVRKLFRRDLDDPAGYDLQLNLSHLDREAAEAAVLSLLRAKPGVLA